MTRGLTSQRLVKSPNGTLNATALLKPWQPRSVGVDGMFYGRHGFDGITPANAIFRSGDGFASVEVGYDFTAVLPEGEGISWATKTTDGYVAISHSVANDTGTIWFSATFAGPFAAVLSMKATQLLAISRPVVSRITGKTILTVGEYNESAATRSLYGSFDGGQTWSILRTMAPSDTTRNAHWHASQYDPDTDRIWASHGDGPNGWFGYSDDHGTTWTEHRFAASDPLYTDSGQHQPTVIAPLRQRLALCPDGGTFDTGIWQADKPGLDIKAVLSAIVGVPTFEQYGAGPYALSGDECYVAFGPSGSTTDELVISGTGDGGRSWHNVYTQPLQGGSHTTGMVGPDSAGRLAWPSVIGTTNTLFVAPSLDWS
jgi:hypothetical protein